MNGFVTRLGLCVGRMFQTCFPPLPEFQGRQVVTLHNQRDFLFFRRHRYAFRSTEKVALQEIGPRFTLKLRWLKKGIPAVQQFGAPPKPLEFDAAEPAEEQGTTEREEPVKDAHVFLTRFVLHDWSDKYAKMIMKKLREAAQPQTKLIVVDYVIQYASPPSAAPECAKIPGVEVPPVPAPLLPTAGQELVYSLDMQVCGWSREILPS